MSNRSLNLLVVEDNAASARLILEELKETAGGGSIAVATAASMGEAVAALRHAAFDAILLDLSLPDSQGGETMEQVRTAAPSVPVIILTSLDDEQLANDLVSRGAQDYLVKGRADGRAIARALRYAIGRRHAEQERDRVLAESERRRQLLQKLVDNAPVGIAAVEAPSMRFIFANSTYRAITGTPGTPMVGRTIEEVFPAVEAAGGFETLREVCRTGRAVSLRDHLANVGPAREKTWWDIEQVPLFDAEGRVASILIIANEVTGKVIARRRLEELAAVAELNLSQLEAVVGNMTEGLLIADASGNFLNMNRAGLAIHGFADVEECRRHLGWYHDLFELRDMEGNVVPLDRWPISLALRGVSFSDLELSVRRRDNGRNWIGNYGGAAVRDRDGRVILGLVTFRDVTASKLAQQQLTALNETLEERVAERTALAERRADQVQAIWLELAQAEQQERRRLADMLHDDLQQLLAAARMWTGIIRTNAGPGEVLDAVKEVDVLLAQSIQASRSLSLELSPPILYEAGLVPAIEWLARWYGQKHNFTVEVEAQPGVGEAAEALRAYLFQAVRELLLNVIKHAGVQAARVRLTRFDQSSIRIDVDDEGRGFDPSVRASEGLSGGFGLFSIRERIELLGGHMDIDSAAGRGTRITIIAPIAEARGDAAGRSVAQPGRAPKAAPPAPAAALVPDGGIRVLIADDHKIVREGLIRLLQEHRDIVIVGEAADGLEAVSLCRDTRPDVVIMDVSMPRISGIEATRRISAELPDVRIIALSFHEEADMAAAMRRAGAGAYLTKGGPSERLITAIRSCRPVTAIPEAAGPK